MDAQGSSLTEVDTHDALGRAWLERDPQSPRRPLQTQLPLLTTQKTQTAVSYVSESRNRFQPLLAGG